jgi:hypothetical protein
VKFQRLLGFVCVFVVKRKDRSDLRLPCAHDDRGGRRGDALLKFANRLPQVRKTPSLVSGFQGTIRLKKRLPAPVEFLHGIIDRRALPRWLNVGRRGGGRRLYGFLGRLRGTQES